MRHRNIILLCLMSILVLTLCSDDENCVWKYRCCSFGEIDGEVKCLKMCEPEITCEEINQSDVESFKPDNGNDDQLAPLSLSGLCRGGHQFINGRCRRIFGKTRQRNPTIV